MDRSFLKYDSGAYHWQKLAGRGRHRHARLHARYGWFVDNCPQGTTVDLGCGDGALSHLLAADGRRVIGVEPDPRAVELARSLAPEVDFRVGTAADIPPADVLVMSEVIEHLEDPAAALVAARAAAPVLLVSTPQRQREPADQLHVQEFTADELHDLLALHYDEVVVSVAEPPWLLRPYLASRVVRSGVNLVASIGPNPFTIRRKRRRGWHQLYAVAKAR